MNLTRVAAVKAEWLTDKEAELETKTKWIKAEQDKIVFYRNELDLLKLEKEIEREDTYKNKEQGLNNLIENAKRYIEFLEKSANKDRIKIYILRGGSK